MFISLSQCLRICTAHRLLPRLEGVPFIVLFGVVISVVPGCTSFQTQENTLEQISTIENMRYSQVLTNLSVSIDQNDSVPSQGVENSGTATTSATGTLGASISQAVGPAFNPFALARSTKSLSPMASVNWQNNWGITPVYDPQDLQNLRALYGLIYRRDDQIVDFIGDTMKIQSSSTRNPIDLKLLNAWAEVQCGISLGISLNGPPSDAMKVYFGYLGVAPDAIEAYLNSLGISLNAPKGIHNPNDAMEAYFNAMRAFPQTSSSYKNSTDQTDQTDQTQSSTGQKQQATSQQATLKEKCYGDVSTTGIANDSLASNYGLLYPTISDVFIALRNGLSPACRNYQLKNMFESEENGIIKGDMLFTRWLFWKARDGTWLPVKNPPSEPQYLANYGGRDFWTTSTACLDDFILLTINATANSHAAAQAAPKTTTTPATQQ